MDLKEQLVDSGKIVGNIVADQIGDNPFYYKQIVRMTLYEPMPMQSRAGRVLNIVTEKYPYLFLPYVDEILAFAQKGHVLHRCILKVFAEVPLPLNEDQEGILLDLCFGWLENRELEIAPVVFCFTILHNIVKKEPDLAPELAETIRQYMPHATPGIQNRGGRILKALSKINRF
jgi:hypothetical protein